MASPATFFAAVALIPVMIGPIASEGHEILVALCGGGTMSVPLDRAPAPGEGNAPCCAKGCHSGQSRKRLARGI